VSHPPAPAQPLRRIARVARVSRVSRVSHILFAASLAGACSKDDGGTVTTAHARGESDRAAARPEGGVVLPGIAAGSSAYVVEPVVGGGTVTGTVYLDGVAPADTSIVPPEEIARQCGGTFTDATISVRGGRLGGAAVWLEGVRRGKAPPAVRRYAVSIAKCRLTPRVQTVFAGGTLHLKSEDRLKSLVRVLRWPGGEVAATIATNDDGQVVPDDRVLAEPAALELNGAQPGWLRAWVLAFDHPYATTTADAGTFSLDAVPPGQYTLVAWHERLGRVTQPVTVSAGQTAAVDVRFRAGGGQVTDGAAAKGAADTTPTTRR
jgi:hypothetical protein